MRPIRLVLLAVALAGAIALVWQGYEQHVLAQERGQLVQALAGFVVPLVEYQGSTYLADSAAPLPVLRIAYVSVLSRLDPPFGVEGTDPDKLAASVDDLENFESSLGALYAANQALYITKLFPIDFLRAISDTERARQVLVTKPSDVAVRAYTDQLRAAVQADEEYLDDLLAFLRAQGTDKKGVLAFFDGQTDLPTYIEKLQAYQAVLQDTRAAVETRVRCFERVGDSCPTLTAAFAGLVAASSSTALPAVLPSDVAANQTVMSEFLRHGSPHAQPGPVVALQKSPCFPASSPVYYLTSRMLQGTSTTFSLSFLNDLYFYDTSVHKTDARYTEAFKSAVPYGYQSVSNLYMCLSSGQDLVDALALDILASRLGVKEGVLSKAGIDAQLSKRGLELARAGEIGFAQQQGTSSVYAAEQTLLIERERSAHFDELVHDAIYNEDAATVYAANDERLPLATLFLARSYLPLLLLSYNPSVSPAPLVLTTPRSFAITQFGLVPYSAIADRYSRAQMLAIMLRGDAIQTAQKTAE